MSAPAFRDSGSGPLLSLQAGRTYTVINHLDRREEKRFATFDPVFRQSPLTGKHRHCFTSPGSRYTHIHRNVHKPSWKDSPVHIPINCNREMTTNGRKKIGDGNLNTAGGGEFISHSAVIYSCTNG